MMRHLGAAVGLALAVAACGGGGEEKTTTGAAPAAATGVPECDAYLAKAQTCLQHVPEASRPTMEKAINDQREGFKQLAQNAEAKGPLATSCKQLSDGIEKNPLCK